MLKRLLIGALACAALLPAVAEARPYLALTNRPDLGIFLDVDATTGVARTKRAWFYIVQLVPVSGVKYSSVFEEFDCAGGRHRSLSRVFYDDKMQFLARSDGEREWQYVTPSTSAEVMRDSVCVGLSKFPASNVHTQFDSWQTLVAFQAGIMDAWAASPRNSQAATSR